MYRQHSPAQSTTSLSENDDEDYSKSTSSQEPIATSPAQWSSRHHLPSHSSTGPGSSQTSASYTSRLPPEILIHILKHIHSPRDIYHALLVSRAWCECAVELLWHRPNFNKVTTLGKMMRVLAKDDQTFVYARFIRRLNFLALGSDLSDSLFARLAACVRLERLTLINCSKLSDGALARVLPCCPNLVALDLTGVSEATDRAVVALASSTKRLQGINLGSCKKLTDKGILALAANCPLLRRVKLSNVEQLTDEGVSALAKSCPLLLEIDLNNCRKITDTSVRDLWTFSFNMREMRLSQCAELTDSAFPVPPRSEIVTDGPNPFPSSSTYSPDKLPPLKINKTFEHLRMLDLTACSQITDDAIAGIVAVAPKIRNLVLAKCTQLTDRAVESICVLGKHLHYLHLGHASSITDRSIRSLARSCTRLRYIDLANCTLLTDMSVFELAGLSKLRRIGLVRVSNLTDQAIYSLAERHATLERIHLSYCDQITVMAIHYLLQKLPKLTHLSLTGIPAFRRAELQQFCREPPADFNQGQRAAFCVYSGRGVTELRDFLIDLFNTITDEIAASQNGTEYDDSGEETYPPRYPQETEVVNDGDEEDDEDETPILPQSSATIVVAPGGYRTSHGPIQSSVPMDVDVPPYIASRGLSMARQSANLPVPRSPTVAFVSGHAPNAHVPIPATTRRLRGFGHQPIVEAPTSPAPSDAASNRSAGTNQSSGTAFFRNYAAIQEAANPNVRPGVITPDLVYAEIGHGRGAGITHVIPHIPQSLASIPVDPSAYGLDPEQQSRSVVVESDRSTPAGYSVLDDMSNSHASPHPIASTSWPQFQRDHINLPLSSSPSAREFRPFDIVDGRGRSVKRSLRNTISAAEQYASSFFGGGGGVGDMTSGSHTGSRDEDSSGPHFTREPRERDTRGHDHMDDH